jgi:hypothetical protein
MLARARGLKPSSGTTSTSTRRSASRSSLNRPRGNKPAPSGSWTSRSRSTVKQMPEASTSAARVASDGSRKSRLLASLDGSESSISPSFSVSPSPTLHPCPGSRPLGGDACPRNPRRDDRRPGHPRGLPDARIERFDQLGPVNLRLFHWGLWGSNPRPRDYEAEIPRLLSCRRVTFSQVRAGAVCHGNSSSATACRRVCEQFVSKAPANLSVKHPVRREQAGLLSRCGEALVVLRWAAIMARHRVARTGRWRHLASAATARREAWAPTRGQVSVRLEPDRQSRQGSFTAPRISRPAGVGRVDQRQGAAAVVVVAWIRTDWLTADNQVRQPDLTGPGSSATTLLSPGRRGDAARIAVGPPGSPAPSHCRTRELCCRQAQPHARKQHPIRHVDLHEGSGGGRRSRRHPAEPHPEQRRASAAGSPRGTR